MRTWLNPRFHPSVDSNKLTETVGKNWHKIIRHKVRPQMYWLTMYINLECNVVLAVVVRNKRWGSLGNQKFPDKLENPRQTFHFTKATVVITWICGPRLQFRVPIIYPDDMLAKHLGAPIMVHWDDHNLSQAAKKIAITINAQNYTSIQVQRLYTHAYYTCLWFLYFKQKKGFARCVNKPYASRHELKTAMQRLSPTFKIVIIRLMNRFF